MLFPLISFYLLNNLNFSKSLSMLIKMSNDKQRNHVCIYYNNEGVRLRLRFNRACNKLT
jgi:hypothetical protein